MKFGKSYDEKDQIAKDRAVRRATPHVWFAWHPIRFTNSGRWGWLENVTRHEDVRYSYACEMMVTYWHYKEIV